VVISQIFYPNLPIFFYTDISAISVTFYNSEVDHQVELLSLLHCHGMSYGQSVRIIYLSARVTSSFNNVSHSVTERSGPLDQTIPDICHRHHRRCRCNFFLSSVNFPRMNTKLILFCVIIWHLTPFVYMFFSVNFILRNFACVKEMTNIRYGSDPRHAWVR